jgi:hypothetical protein
MTTPFSGLDLRENQIQSDEIVTMAIGLDILQASYSTVFPAMAQGL